MWTGSRQISVLIKIAILHPVGVRMQETCEKETEMNKDGVCSFHVVKRISRIRETRTTSRISQQQQKQSEKLPTYSNRTRTVWCVLITHLPLLLPHQTVP